LLKKFNDTPSAAVVVDVSISVTRGEVLLWKPILKSLDKT
jgi:hypothetical protein